jgi:hypothetical protein
VALSTCCSCQYPSSHTWCPRSVCAEGHL